jgi:O-antigen ligase
MFLLVLISLSLGWGFIPARLQNRFWTLIDPSVGPENAQQSAEGRTQGLLDGISLWQKSPLLGYGPGAHGLATGCGFQAHNVYGQVLGETGTLGALAFLGIVVCFLANGWEARGLGRKLGKEAGTFSVNLSGAILTALAILLIKGYSDHNLYRYNWLWFGAFQIIAVNCLRAHNRKALACSLTEDQQAEPGLGSAEGDWDDWGTNW